MTIQDYIAFSEIWQRNFWGWHIANYVMGGLMVTGSVAIASSPPMLEKIIGVKNLAFVVAILSAMFTFLSPGERATTYSRAFVKLQAAINEFYEAGGENPAKAGELLPKVRNAYEAGMAEIFQNVESNLRLRITDLLI